jgi:glycosyltransferase involved in cell wall biosynthesis
MAQKSIVIISNTSWSIYNFRFNLAKFLQNNNYDIICIAPKDKYSSYLAESFTYYDIFIDNKGVNPINDSKILYQLYKLYKKIQPDIVLNFTIKPNIYSSIIARILSIPTISNITGLGTVFIKQTIITKLVKRLYKFALQKNYKIFFQNSDDKELFNANNLINMKYVDVLPGSGIDTTKFIPIQTNINENFMFLFIGRLLKDKGIYEFIDAIKIVQQNYPNILFQVVGDIDNKNNTSITQENLNQWIDNKLIEYYRFSDDIASYIANADCVLLPSYREGTPRVLLEAASMEKPLISTNVPGCRNVVDDGVNGFLCEVKNSKDLANKMEKMLNLSKEERQKMGKRGREKMIKEFDEKIVIDKYLQTIKEILQ